jgi:hypothetical protein
MEPEIRDEQWLSERVQLLRHIHFADVPRGYPIVTRFGIRARNRFGSIGAQDQQTIILVNRLFADPFVPTFVVDGTLAHELAHYAHGFGSGLPRLYADPHRGGIVDKELDKRGLGELSRKSELWRKLNWDNFYESRCFDLTARRTARQALVEARWSVPLNCPGNRSEAHLNARLEDLSPHFGFADPPFEVEWLRATLRQSAPSYWFSRSRIVRLHGLLADRRAPACMVEFELGYWLARQAVGDNGARIQRAMEAAGLKASAEEALNWRRRSWAAFCTRHHPLK